MSIETVLAVVSVLMAIIGVVRYLDRFDRHLQNITDLLWKNLEMTSTLVDRPDVMNGFLARSGRVIRPLTAKEQAAGRDS